MSAAERQLNPSEFSQDQLDRFLFALVGRMKVHFLVEKPMTKTQLAEYLNYSEAHIGRWVRSGKIKPHRMEEGADPRFLASEALEALTGKK